MEGKIATLIESVRRMPLYRQLIPQEAGIGWPLPVRVGGRGGTLYVTLPFFGYTNTNGQTRLFPPFATLTLTWANGLPVEYVDLRYRNPLPEIDWKSEAGSFPHAAVASLKVCEYEEAKAEFFLLYDEMLDRLSRGEPLSQTASARFSELMRLLIEPPLVPFYRALAPKFFDRFLVTQSAPATHTSSH
jgi:hypothetical protein